MIIKKLKTSIETQQKDIKITILGGVDSYVNANQRRRRQTNSHLIEIDDKLIIVDTGFERNELGWKKMPSWVDIPKPPAAIIITHAHHDHIGSLIPLISRYPDTPVYLTKATCELTKIQLEQQIFFENKEQPYYNILKNFYNNKGKYYKNFRTYDYKQPFKIGNLDVKFIDAKHILGSAMVIISNGITNILHTGDYNISNSNLLEGVNLGDIDVDIDVLISELSNSANNKENNFIDFTNIVKNRKSAVFIPTFPLRVPQIIQFLNKIGIVNIYLTKNSYITKKILNIAKNFNMNLKYHEEEIADVIKLGNSQENKECVIISEGEDITNKNKQNFKYFKQIKDNENWTLLFPTIYTQEHSKRHISNKINQEIKCYVREYDFSNHTNLEGIKKLIKKTKTKMSIFVHTSMDDNAKKEVANKIKEDSKSVCYFPYNDGEIIYVNKKKKDLSWSSSKESNALVISVGTSINRICKDNSLDEKQVDSETLINLLKKSKWKDHKNNYYSAEISTLENINKEELDLEKIDRVFLVAADGAGKKTANALYYYFTKIQKKATEIVYINNMTTNNENQFYNEGVTELFCKLANIKNKFKEIFFIVSGGFKSMVAYTNLFAILFEKKSFYKHESKKTAVSLPLIPMEFDNSIFNIWNNVLSVVNEGRNEKLQNIPKSLLNVLIRKDNDSNIERYVFTPLGLLLDLIYQEKKENNRIIEISKKQNDSKIRDTMIITVGTSLQTKYAGEHKEYNCKNEQEKEQILFDFLKNNEQNSSAEIATIHKIKNKEEILNQCKRIFLFSSPKGEGKICCNVLKKYCEEILKKQTEIVDINSLESKREEEFYDSGTTELIQKISEKKREYKNLVFIVTGGYKSVTSYAQLAAIIFKDPAYYNQERMCFSACMPSIPIGLDFTNYKIQKDKIDKLFSAEETNKDNIYRSISKKFKETLIKKVNKKYIKMPLLYLIETEYEIENMKGNK